MHCHKDVWCHSDSARDAGVTALTVSPIDPRHQTVTAVSSTCWCTQTSIAPRVYDVRYVVTMAYMCCPHSLCVARSVYCQIKKKFYLLVHVAWHAAQWRMHSRWRKASRMPDPKELDCCAKSVDVALRKWLLARRAWWEKKVVHAIYRWLTLDCSLYDIVGMTVF